MGRINSGTMTVVIFAILVGLGGALVVRQQLRQRPEPVLLEPEPQSAPILVPTAAVDLVPGQALTINEVALLSLAPERFQSSPYAKMAYMRSPEQVTGRTVRRAIKKGDAFLPDDFYPAGRGPGLADRLEPGFRAVTVSIENVGAVQGFAGPGSLVDVLFRSRPEGDRPEVTLTLLERVQVLAVDTQVVPGQQVDLQSGGTVTLSVTPQQAKILKVVEGRGELSLTLRSDADVDVLPFDLGTVDPFLGRLDGPVTASAVGMSTNRDAGAVHATADGSAERVTLDDLLGLPATLPPRQMEIYLGPEKTVVQFPRPAELNYQLLQNGGRIRTPIAQDPQSTTPRLGDAAPARPASAPALVSRDR